MLVIDDDALVADALSLTLGDEHDVTTVTSAKEALDLLTGRVHLDAILCDLMMPNMTGMDFYTKVLHVMPRDIGRIVFMTGAALNSHSRAFLKGVGNRWIEKPIDLRELWALVRGVRRTSAQG